ncbi:MAG: hypothetical protein U0821_25445 [Chloroflexota bacterium]
MAVPLRVVPSAVWVGNEWSLTWGCAGLLAGYRDDGMSDGLELPWVAVDRWGSWAGV